MISYFLHNPSPSQTSNYSLSQNLDCFALHVTVSMQLCQKSVWSEGQVCLSLCALFEYGVPQGYFTELFANLDHLSLFLRM